MNATTLPILDLARYTNPAEKAGFLADLRQAARDIGFFYLINHGVDAGLQTEVQRQARRFFALDDSEKQQVAMIHSPHFRGYNRAASELTRGQPDWREQFDTGAERPALTLAENAPRWQRLQGPNLWPAALPSLKPTLLGWQQAMTGIGMTLLRAFAEALQLPADAFDALYGDKPNEHIKLIRYPGQRETKSDQGVGAHKDSGFLSFLLQDEQKGLQVEVAPDHWIDATPLAGSFVVNIGELLELATNGYLRATVHRVVSPPFIAWSRRRQNRNASLSPSFLAHSSMPWCRCTACPPIWRRKRSARIAIRKIRCCGMLAGITSKGGCVPTRTSPNVITRMFFANVLSN